MTALAIFNIAALKKINRDPRGFRAAEILLDPLGDKELRPVYTRHAPNISVLRPPPVESEMYAYRRFSRDYMSE